MKKFKTAICQNKQGFNKEKNIRQAIDMVETAAGKGAALVVLPEIFYYPFELAAKKEIIEEDGHTLSLLTDCARKCGIHLCTGSVGEKGKKGATNTSYLISPSGRILLRHSKCHLFDASFKTLRVRESAVFVPGSEFTVAATPLAKIGILICYDIRFPEAARQLTLMGAEIILVPAAFNTVTGPAHWHVNFRCRAIENQVFIAAASPARNPRAQYKAYGHSMIINPWGKVLAEAGTKHSIVYADLDPKVLKDTRRRLPLLKHRRPDIYSV